MSEKKIGRPRRRGRPNKDPNYVKENVFRIRLDNEDESTLYCLSKWLGISKSDVVRYALRNFEIDYIKGEIRKEDCLDTIKRRAKELKTESEHFS